MAFLKKTYTTFCVTCLMGLVISLLLFLHLTKDGILNNSMNSTSLTYLVNTPGCRIPAIDPFDPSIVNLVEVHRGIKCEAKPSVTHEDGDMIRIDWATVKSYYSNSIKYCRYTPIVRGKKQSDAHFSYKNMSTPFTQDIQMQDEFVIIHCFNEADAIVYKNFHALIISQRNISETFNKRLAGHQETNKPKEIMNVLMIGVDSVSRINSLRQLTLTRKYLLENLEAVEMRGYTKVADNTFVNIVPILSGKFAEELPWNETMKKEPFDKYNFIWKNFSQNGYITMYAEDVVGGAIFNYFKGGFRHIPTDHYLMPFTLAVETDKSIWNSNHRCVGDRQEDEVILNYVRDFSKLYQRKPHFGFIFLSRLTHDDVNAAGVVDHPHFIFLQRAYKENLLNNTILIYYSDHGIRFGKLRRTYIGKVEERMPYLFFVLPGWFKKKYSNIVQNMEINVERLTTPFDVHETLKDILYFKGEVITQSKDKRGLSLFSEIPANRSCADAGILPHWCMCSEKKSISTSSEQVKLAADMVLYHINGILSGNAKVCARLRLRNIVSAFAMVSNNDVLRYKGIKGDQGIDKIVLFDEKVKTQVMFQITLVTVPGRGMFEVTVKFDETNQQYLLAGDISRIDKYGTQSTCISDTNLKKYCFCK